MNVILDNEVRERDDVQVSVFIGHDGAFVVQIDTTADKTGHLRVNVNEGTVFDADPEKG